MPLDPRIAMGFQSPQFESPINLMGKLSEMTANANQSKLAQAKLASQLQADAELKGINALAATPNFDINNPAMLQQLNASEPGRKFVADYYTGATNRANFQKADTEVINSEIAGRLAALESIGPKNPNLGKLLTSWRQGTQGNQHLQTWMNSQGIKQPTDEEYLPMVSTPEGALEQYNGSLRALRALAGKGKPNVTQASTIGGEEFIDNNPESPTFGQTLFSRRSPPKSPGTVIHMGDRSFGKGLGEGASKNFAQNYDDANSANDSYRNTNNLYPLVNNPDFISGAMGDWRAVAAKQLGLPGVAETDAYFSQIGKEVGQEVKAFGAGTGISEGDRKYAAEIAGGSRTMKPETIRAIMYLRQMINRHKIRKYNERRTFLDSKNPDANISGMYEEIPVPPPPAFNAQGWELHQDKNGGYAYFGPAGKNGVRPIQEVK
jgi:hypothetical protein